MVVVAPDSINVPQVKATSLEVSDGDVIIDSSGTRINGSYVPTDANIAQIAEQAAAEQIAASTTDDIDEGTSNQYFTVSRPEIQSQPEPVWVITQRLDKCQLDKVLPQLPRHSLLVFHFPSMWFRDLYLSGSTIYVGDEVISFDSTSNSFQFKSELELDITVTQSPLTYSTASTSANQIADTTDASQASTVKYLVQAANGNNF